MQFPKFFAFTSLILASLVASPAQATPFAACAAEPKVQFDGNIVEAAIATPELSTLVTAVTAAGLGDALAEASDITVYAPTNDAFAQIPGDVLNALLADVDTLSAVLLYHVSPGIRDPRYYIEAHRAPSLLTMQPLFFHRAGAEPRVNSAVVSCTGVQTSNGIVWLIDSVLTPQF